MYTSIANHDRIRPQTPAANCRSGNLLQLGASMSCSSRVTESQQIKPACECISRAEHEAEIGKLKRKYAVLGEELKARRDENPDLIWHPKSKVFTYNGVIQGDYY
jgi:hypothetical protein